MKLQTICIALLLSGGAFASGTSVPMPQPHECLPPEAWVEVTEIPLRSTRDVTRLAHSLGTERNFMSLRGFAWLDPFSGKWWVVYVRGDEAARNHEIAHTRCPFWTHD